MILWLFVLMAVLKDASLLKIPPKYNVMNTQDEIKPIQFKISHLTCSTDKHCKNGYICDLVSYSCVPKPHSIPKPIILPTICMGDENCPDGYICDLGSNSDLGFGTCFLGKA